MNIAYNMGYFWLHVTSGMAARPRRCTGQFEFGSTVLYQHPYGESTWIEPTVVVTVSRV